MNYHYRVSGIDCVTLYFGESMSEQLVQNIGRARDLLLQDLGETLLDAVPSYTSLMLRYDLLKISETDLKDRIDTLLSNLDESPQTKTGPTIEIPVFYHPKVGPDLERIAKQAKLTVDEVIGKHSEKTYLVFAIGFAPGFAYLGELDAQLVAPRLDSPRAKVPAGSLGIAENQTAIYPLPSPGGWNLIGRTPLNMFDPRRSQPSLLHAGQRVRFRPISEEEFLAQGGSLDD